MAKRDLGFDHEDNCGKLEIMPRFHFYITVINSKHQSSFLFSFRVELMLLLAQMGSKVFDGIFSCLQIVELTGR